jgi:PKD repeat protein
MRKHILSFLLALFFPAIFFAQSSFPVASFSGQVLDANTGLPLANQPVSVYASYGTPNWYYSNTLYTNANGVYADSTQPDTSHVTLYVYTLDCNGNVFADSFVYNNGLQNSVANFSVCAGASSIMPNFSFAQTQGYTVQFTNLSSGLNPLQYNWNFGNGTTSTQTNPVVNFGMPGVYSVILTASDNISSSQYHYNVFVTGTQGNCAASFSYTTDLVGGVVLTNTSININPYTVSTLDVGGYYSNVPWYLAYPYGYNYADSGAYRVCMAYQDSLCASVFCDTIASVGVPNGNTCYATFNHQTFPGGFVQFNAQTSAANPLVTWDFGDGTPPFQGNVNDLSTTHIYPIQGIYYPCITILNPASGCQSTYCDTIVANPNSANLQAAFTYTVANNGMVYFTDTSSPQGSLNYQWDFGNGTTSTLFSPSTAYTSAGWYNVCVLVTDIYVPGSLSSFCDSIYIPTVQIDTCQASFTYVTNPDSSVTFTSTAYGDNLSSYWNIYNSFYSISASGPVVTAFVPAGVYQVDFYVYGNICNGSQSQTVSIGGLYQPCDAGFSYTIQPSGLVQFTNTSISSSSIFGGNYYYWDFGNGFTSSATDPNMIYSTVGSYTVNLMQFDLFSGCQSIETQIINITSIIPNTGNCQANFSAVADSTGLITFTDLSTPTGIVYDYFWNFGDGTYSTMQNNQHFYGTSGTYNVCLTVLDATTGCNSLYCDTISAQGYNYNLACDADFSYFADSAGNIQFFAPFSNNPPGLTDYYWDFGNGVIDNTQNPLYTYNDSLTHWVCLTVFDLQTACSQTYCDSVVPFSGYNARFAYQAQGNMVVFDNKSTGTNNMTYQWNLGQGQISQQKDPIAVYNAAGWQNVCLTIWENGMMKGMYCDSVFINNITSNIEENVGANTPISAIYPNPSNDRIYLDFQNLKENELNWTIQDILGREVKQGSEKTQNTDYQLSISVGSLPKGCYFLAVKVGEERVVRKFVVE